MIGCLDICTHPSMIDFSYCSIMIHSIYWYFDPIRGSVQKSRLTLLTELTFGHNFLDGVLLQSNGSQGTLKGWFNETFSAFLHTILQLYCRSISHLVMAATQNCLRSTTQEAKRGSLRSSSSVSSPKGILLMIQQHWGPIICKTPS